LRALADESGCSVAGVASVTGGVLQVSTAAVDFDWKFFLQHARNAFHITKHVQETSMLLPKQGF
jgi:hypothetical protein